MSKSDLRRCHSCAPTASHPTSLGAARCNPTAIISRRRPQVAVAFLLVLVSLTFASCPIPISDLMIERLNDVVDPIVMIDSPFDESYYSATIVVSGTVSDTTGGASDQGEIARLSYEIVPALALGSGIELATDGSFDFQFATSGFSGSILVRVTAEDWNGRVGSSTVTLHNAENGIPTLTAETANKGVTLSWEQVALAESYTLYYTTNGTYPSSTYGEPVSDVTSPWPISGLKNGNKHIFLLQAHSSSGPDNWSDYVTAVPLSGRSLAPSLMSSHGSIRVEWNGIDATDSYEVWRSTSTPDNPVNISGTYVGTVFEDTNVETGLHYYYSVRPALEGASKSDSTWGRADPFPPERVTREGWLDTSSDSLTYHYGVAVREPYAYVAGSQFYRIDVSIPATPVVDATTYFSSSAREMTISDDYAYVTGATKFMVIDIFDTESVPTIEKELSALANAYDVVVNGGYAYVVDYTNIDVVDVDPPTDANVLGTINGKGPGITTNGTYLYVVESSNTVGVWNLGSTPEAPPFEGRIDTPGSAYGVAADSSYLYVADQYDGLQIYGAASRTLVGTVDTPGRALAVASDGTYAYVADDSRGMHVILVADPTNPRILGSFDTTDSAQDVAFDGPTICLVAGQSGLHVFRSFVPSPAIIDTIATGDWANSVAVSSSHVVVAANAEGTKVYDRTDFSVPPILIPVVSSAKGVSIAGEYAYVAAYEDGVSISPISGPDAFTIESVIDTPGFASDVAIQGDYAYVADMYGLEVIDVSDPAAPFVVGSLATSGSAIRVAAQGDIVCLRTTDAVEVIDISDPTSPTRIGSADITAAQNVALVDGYCLVPAGFNGLRVFDTASGPPYTVIPCSIAGFSYGVAVSGEYAYVANSSMGLNVVDISDPGQPVYLGRNLLADGNGVAVDGDEAFVVSSSGEYLQVIDLAP